MNWNVNIAIISSRVKCAWMKLEITEVDYLSVISYPLCIDLVDIEMQ